VLPVGKRYESARTGGWIQVVERTPDSMSFERMLKPGSGHADPHVHLDLTQTWEAVQGEGLIEAEGEQKPFRAGDREAMTPERPHRDPWNTGPGELVVRGTFEPCAPFIEAYAEALVHHITEGTANDQDEMPLLQILVIAKETDGRSYRAGVPPAIQRLGLPLAAAIGRLRGYRASYD
jgi:mannose-6-phosphate isomerase-like protein (cupin superfamily)